MARHAGSAVGAARVGSVPFAAGSRWARTIREDVLRIEMLGVAAVAIFIAVSFWWVAADTRVPDGDNGKHLAVALGYLDQLRAHNWLEPFIAWSLYPPLVHLVAAVGAATAGRSVASMIAAENLVFVPLLALGCYGTGRVAFGRRAGVLAVLFALAIPMVVSLFHVVMLDAPEAAAVAVTVWLLLRSNRFASLRYSVFAGIAFGVGMYVKQTFVLFVVGLLVTLLFRGGWRNWRNAVAFAATALILIEPWYSLHYVDLRGQTFGAVAGQQPLWYGSTPYPSRWSLDNFTWYGWNLINNQLYLPLTLLFVAGTAASIWWWRRGRASYVPELVAGGVTSYFLVSLITLDDPRYSLPALVYAATLATGWLENVRGHVQLVAVTLVALVFAVNLGDASVGASRTVIWDLPGAVGSPIGERRLTVRASGYTTGPPQRVGAGRQLEAELRAAREEGFQRVVFQPESMNSGGYNLNGLAVISMLAGLTYAGARPEDVGGRDGFYVFRQLPRQVPLHRPCVISFDGTGIFFVAEAAPPHGRLFCPRSH